MMGVITIFYYVADKFGILNFPKLSSLKGRLINY